MWFPGREGDRLAVVEDFERVAAGQDVPGVGVRSLDPQAPASDEEVEREPGEAVGEPRRDTVAERCLRLATLGAASVSAGRRGPVQLLLGVVGLCMPSRCRT